MLNRCINNVCNLYMDNTKKTFIENSESFVQDKNIRVPSFNIVKNKIEVRDFPVAFALRENKKGRIYLEETLYSGYQFYKEIINEQKVFRFMFDGHYDDDDYSKVLGYINDIRQSDEDKGIYADFAVLLSHPSGQLIKDIIFELGGDIGVSMRIFVEDEEEIPRVMVKERYPDVVLIDEQFDNLGKLFKGAHSVVSVQKGKGFIQRIDIVSMPSDNNASAGLNNLIQLKEESFKFKYKLKSKNKSKEKKESFTVKKIITAAKKDKYQDLLNKYLSTKKGENNNFPIQSFEYKLDLFILSYIIQRKLNDKSKLKKEFLNLFKDKNELINYLNSNRYLIDNSIIIFDLFKEDILKKYPNALNMVLEKGVPFYLILIKYFNEP